jgi:hypothetical protein
VLRHLGHGFAIDARNEIWVAEVGSGIFEGSDMTALEAAKKLFAVLEKDFLSDYDVKLIGMNFYRVWRKGDPKGADSEKPDAE